MATIVERRYSFGAYLRTGRLETSDGVEHKFSPNHDPEDGRFTFSEGGKSDAQPSDEQRAGKKVQASPSVVKHLELPPAEYNQRG